MFQELCLVQNVTVVDTNVGLRYPIPSSGAGPAATMTVGESRHSWIGLILASFDAEMPLKAPDSLIQGALEPQQTGLNLPIELKCFSFSVPAAWNPLQDR